VAALLAADTEAVVQRLALRLVETHHLNRESQVRAWRAQIALLRGALSGFPGSWHVLLEYPLLRLGRRIDAVILTDRVILVLEFKVGATGFGAADRAQVDDYALDLFDFHAASRDHPVVPLLVATEARPTSPAWPLLWHGVTQVLDVDAGSLANTIRQIIERAPPLVALDAAAWEAAPYHPVPTIVEAAQMLYGRHGVAEIAAARAEIANLTRTTEALLSAIDSAQRMHQHLVLFVTGIPGAGKTLCGLNVVFGTDSGAAFLTGNLPLVHVMREALARDAQGQGRSLRQARQETESALQPLIGFLRDNLPRSAPPHEHVIVFDEAQRAWDAEFGRRKFGHAESEAALFLDIMHRHNDWAVIVALVGGGQEINTGEAGLAEWGRALLARPSWRVRAAPTALTNSDARQLLFAIAPAALEIDPALHLDVPVRSIHSGAVAPWVDAVLAGDADRAAGIAAGGIPVRITRSLAALRAALRRRARGTRRSGLVCSAGAKRLIADGLWPEFPHLDRDAVANWFLRRWPDVRASDALEVPATQFAIQGLELDYVGLAWGNDLVRRDGRWTARAFIGSGWQDRRRDAGVAYVINTYRVLLTRARYETIIWVPRGDQSDATRPPWEFDQIARFLEDSGAGQLESEADETTALAREALLL